MQGVCEENKKELEEKNNCPLKYFADKGSTLEGCRITATIRIQTDFHYNDSLHHKDNSTVLSN